jgi:hypothetical protein
MKSQYSKIKKIVFGFALMTIPFVTSAQSSYQPITPRGKLPFIERGTVELGPVLIGLFKAGVTISALLAVTMLIVGGIEYMGSDSVFAKNAGREKISAALGGLLIALTCVLILGIIFGFGGGGSGGGGSFDVNLNFGGK